MEARPWWLGPLLSLVVNVGWQDLYSPQNGIALGSRCKPTTSCRGLSLAKYSLSTYCVLNPGDNHASCGPVNLHMAHIYIKLNSSITSVLSPSDTDTLMSNLTVVLWTSPFCGHSPLCSASASLCRPTSGDMQGTLSESQFVVILL